MDLPALRRPNLEAMVEMQRIGCWRWGSFEGARGAWENMERLLLLKMLKMSSMCKERAKW